MLLADGVGQRSGTSPFAGLPSSQKKSKVRRSRSTTRSGTWRSTPTGFDGVVSDACGGGAWRWQAASARTAVATTDARRFAAVTRTSEIQSQRELERPRHAADVEAVL